MLGRLTQRRLPETRELPGLLLRSNGTKSLRDPEDLDDETRRCECPAHDISRNERLPRVDKTLASGGYDRGSYRGIWQVSPEAGVEELHHGWRRTYPLVLEVDEGHRAVIDED